MRPYFKYYKHASSCLSGDVVSRSGLYMRDARVRVGSSVGRESDRHASGRGHVRVVGARVVVSGIGEKRVRCIYAPGFLTPRGPAPLAPNPHCYGGRDLGSATIPPGSVVPTGEITQGRVGGEAAMLEVTPG